MAQELALEQPITTLTVGEFRELLRTILREERQREYYLNDEGYLVFTSEQAYAIYLSKQGGKLPNEVPAYFIDERGNRAVYSDGMLALEEVR